MRQNDDERRKEENLVHKINEDRARVRRTKKLNFGRAVPGTVRKVIVTRNFKSELAKQKHKTPLDAFDDAKKQAPKTLGHANPSSLFAYIHRLVVYEFVNANGRRVRKLITTKHDLEHFLVPTSAAALQYKLEQAAKENERLESEIARLTTENTSLTAENTSLKAENAAPILSFKRVVKCITHL